MNDHERIELENAAEPETQEGLLRELWEFLWENKKWWLLPMTILLLILGLLICFSGSGLAPFIYTLF